ncbi:choice-of-anchor D domain-containing protein [Candidatus Eisenbacteria bacterium]|uniref:Choice-of-anchor D domain-containing protein n=1 Tax=Eiseniibacteriota bacterium TaxID=2212470 RepID=A0ABV6YJ87_UNCEI
MRSVSFRDVHRLSTLVFSLAALLLLSLPANGQTVVNVLPAPDYAWGLDYYDGYLWAASDGDGFIYKVDPADGAVLDILPTPYDENHSSFGANHGLAWDGSGFWVAGDYGKDWIYKVGLDGTFLDTLDTPADAIGGLAWDGTYLLVTRYYPNTQADLLQVDTGDGSIVGTIPTQGQQPFGIFYDTTDGTVWNGMDDNDGDPERIWHLNYPSGSVIDHFDAPASSPKGIALGGGYMWVVANEIGGYGRRIYQIDLSGAGTGDIDPLPPEYNFGIIPLGTPGTYPQTLLNVGDGDLTITGITTGAPFFADPVSLPVVLASFESINFEVSFDPQAAGNHAGILRVTSDDFDERILDIPLSGTAVFPEPMINPSPSVLNFPDTGVGMVRGLELDLQNLGYQPLEITTLSSNNGYFRIPKLVLPLTLTTFETLTLAVSFEPQVLGTQNGILTITSNDPATPSLEIGMSGEALFKSWSGGEIIWSAQGIEDVNCVQPIPDLGGDGAPEVVMESYDAGAPGDPHVAFRGNSDGTGVAIWSTGVGGSGGWGDLCLSLVDDLDDDGFPEILRGTAWGGRKIEVRGSEDGELLWEFDTYVHDGGGWVYTVAPMPDVSGDGIPEVLAGAGTAGEPGSGSRRIYCFDGVTGHIRFMYLALEAFNHVTAIDDVNGDDVPDVVGSNADGYVYCVSGASSGLGSQLWSYDTGGNASFVDVIEDVSGDGIADVIAGSWSGQVFCLDGTTGDWVWRSPIGNWILQTRVIDDVTGDGISDVAVCNTGNSFRVLNGSDGTLHWSKSTGGNVWSIYPIPDVDGDGVTDVLAGAQDDLVYCVSGASDDTIGDVIWTTYVGALVFSVRSIGDVNHNGTPDVIAGTQYLNGSGGRIFCIEGGRPLAHVDSETPAAGTSIRLLGAHPNPAVTTSTIFLQTSPDFDGNLEIDIYDLAGRRVQSLARKAQPGLNQLLWDGRIHNGLDASNGVYFYRLRGQEDEAGSGGKITLQR